MGVLGRLMLKNYTLEEFVRDTQTFFRGRKTLAGVTVSEDSALRYITVYSCVKVLAETLGALPMYVYRRRRDGKGADEAWDHPLYSLLHDAPNEEMPSMTWREAQTGHMALSGNCFSAITTNKRGQVIDLYPVDWHLVTPERNAETRRLQYRINDRGKDEILPASRMFHVPAFSANGIVGYSPMRMAAESVGLGMAATEFASRFYGQGMNVGGLLEHPGALSDKAWERLQASIDTDWAGLENSWRPIILEENMKFSRVPMPLREAQFIEQQKLNRDEICGLYRVPPHMIANLEKATFSNIEHLSIEFVMFTMLPWVKRWEQVANMRLFTREERVQGYYARFNLNALLRGDAKSQAEALQLMRQNGAINADEWRAMVDMNPIGGVVGEVHLVNGNMISTETAAKQLPRQTGSSRSGGGESGNEG